MDFEFQFCQTTHIFSKHSVLTGWCFLDSLPDEKFSPNTALSPAGISFQFLFLSSAPVDNTL